MNHALALESDDEQRSDLPELPLSPHPNYVTPRGLTQLSARLADAESRLALFDGDAVLDRNYLDRQIRWLQARIASAIPINEVVRDRVGFGASVDVQDENGQRRSYRIVGEDEADPEHGVVSWMSPLARALTGTRVGDSVLWQRPDGDLEVEVLGIAFDGEA